MRSLSLAVFALWVSPTTIAQTSSPSTSSSSACTANDFTLYKQDEFAKIFGDLDYCGKKSFGDETKSRACLQSLSSLSASCIECQVSLISCTVLQCASPCASGGRTNPACVSCVETQGCNAAFRQCTGWPFPTCDVCIQTLAPTGTGGFVPGVDLGASIGIVVGPIIGIAILVLLWRFKVFHDDDRVFATQQTLVQMSPRNMGGSGSQLAMPIQSPGSFNGSPPSAVMKGKQANIDMFAGYNPSMAGLSPAQQMTYGKQQQQQNPYAPTGYNAPDPYNQQHQSMSMYGAPQQQQQQQRFTYQQPPQAAYQQQAPPPPLYPTFSPMKPPSPPGNSIMDDI